MFIGGVLNLCVRRAQRQLQHCPRQWIMVSSRARLVEISWMLLSCQYARTRTFCNPVSLNSTGTAVPVSGVPPQHS
jgi:hypothetical protein